MASTATSPYVADKLKVRVNVQVLVDAYGAPTIHTELGQSTEDRDGAINDNIVARGRVTTPRRRGSSGPGR